MFFVILFGLVVALAVAIIRGALLWVMFQIVNIAYVEQFSFWQCVGIGVIAALLFQSDNKSYKAKS